MVYVMPSVADITVTGAVTLDEHSPTPQSKAFGQQPYSRDSGHKWKFESQVRCTPMASAGGTQLFIAHENPFLQHPPVELWLECPSLLL